jgi:hypothetical protein
MMNKQEALEYVDDYFNHSDVDTMFAGKESVKSIIRRVFYNQCNLPKQAENYHSYRLGGHPSIEPNCWCALLTEDAEKENIVNVQCIRAQQLAMCLCPKQVMKPIHLMARR